ncbi:MAG TPA: hypothetical protein VGO85_01745 [Caldimonas sp.]|nr:hypothetical protein [Caldimonas sp.]
MKRSLALVLAACAAAATAPFARAADAPATATPPAAAAPAALPLEIVDPAPGKVVSEPAIKRTVIEDRSARIEELRVRGQLQKVTVSPKGGAPGYEVLLGDGAHVIGDDPGTSRGSAGKRVWNVLRF